MLFLDSSIPKEIEELGSWGVFSGVTTNRLIFARESGDVDLEQRIKEILAVSTGHVSVELIAETHEEMVSEALGYHEWDRERVCIKIPFSENGLRVNRQLVERGVPTNLTCMMSFNQMYLAALGRAIYVSIFSGRVRDMGYDVRPIIQQVRAMLDREQLPSKIIVGSIRQLMDVTEALQAGAHIVTVPPAIVRKMLWNPQTELTTRQFNEAWKNRGK